MRQLRIVVKTASGALPLVLAATVVSAEACGNSSEHTNGLGGSADATANAGHTAGMMAGAGGQGGTGIIVLQGGSGGNTTGNAGEPPSDCSAQCTSVQVELPEPGVPAEPGQICAATVEPIASNRAALITFEETRGQPMFNGHIAVAKELDGLVVGTPSLEVVDASNALLANMTFSGVTPVAGGFTFQAAIDEHFAVEYERYDRVTLRATLEIQCDDGTRLVHSANDVYFCFDSAGFSTASIGDSCCVCRVIAEMAPSPIVPGEVHDELPLAQALRLRIVELARIGNTLILLAENDGGDGLEYEWLASAGSIEKLAPDVVQWTLAAGQLDPLLQAAVSGPRAAAVASFAFNEHVA